MKLIFPNREHEQVELAPGTNLIGCDLDCTICIHHPSIAERHAQIELVQRRATLKVFDVTNITRINGELVAATRLLHSGDALQLGEIQCVVVGESRLVPPPGPEPALSDERPVAETRVRVAVPSYALRGVSGSSFGRVYPVFDTTRVGRSPDADIRIKRDEISRQHAELSFVDEQLMLRDLKSANGTFVNGKRVRRATLSAGDEVSFDDERFLVQGPESGAVVAKEHSRRRSALIWLVGLLAMAAGAWYLSQLSISA